MNSAAASNAKDVLRQRSDAKRLTAKSLMTPVYNAKERINREIKSEDEHGA